MEEVYIENSDSSNEFDAIIGAIEDVVVDEEFQELQQNLLKIYNHHFEVCCAFPKNLLPLYKENDFDGLFEKN